MVPKIIHCIWFSGDEKPEKMKECMATWVKNLPDYEIREWSLKDVEVIRKENPYLDQALNNKKWSWASDFLRLWILYNIGGIYLDTDVEVLKSFDPFLNDGFFTCYERNKSLEAAVMGSEKGNKFAKEFLELYSKRNFEEELKKGFPEIIPIILADYISKNYKYKARNRHTILEGLHIYPYKYFSPKNGYKNRIEKNDFTVCIHNFANSWCDTKQKTSTKLWNWSFYVFRNIFPYRLSRSFEKFMWKFYRFLKGKKIK